MHRAVNLKAQAVELGALGALADAGTGPAAAAPAAAVSNLKEMLELARMLQPDVLGTLRTAVEMVRGTGAPAGGGTLEQLSALEKVAGIVERFAGGGGGAAKSGAWDFAIEALRQVAPMVPALLPALVQVAIARGGAAPAPGPAPAPAVPGPPAPVTALPRDVSTLPPGSDPVLTAVEGDAAKAERLRNLLNVTWWEMGTATDPEAREGGFERVADLADAHLPGLVEQLHKLGPEAAWQLWMTLDPRVLNAPAAAPWVREFVEWIGKEDVA